jgi:hypothetical protein
MKKKPLFSEANRPYIKYQYTSSRSKMQAKNRCFFWFFGTGVNCGAELAGQNSLNIRTFSRNLWQTNENLFWELSNGKAKNSSGSEKNSQNG